MDLIIHPFMHSCIYSSNHPSIPSTSILSYIHSLIHPSIHAFIHPFIHPSSIHPSIHEFFITSYIHSNSIKQVCYSQGTVDSLNASRKHFSTALKLNPGSLRSLYGLHQTVLHLSTNPKLKGKREEKVKNEDILSWTSSQLQHKYQVVYFVHVQ